MDIWDENKILIFIAFVVPGFIAIKFYELLYPSRFADSSKQIIDAISFSCLNYAFLIFPIYLVESHGISYSNPVLYAFFWTFVLFVAPVLWVIGFKALRHCEWVQKFIPHPVQKPWDFVFSQRRCYWVVVTLKNDQRIAGKYGQNSFASSAPHAEQIYLEEEWLLNVDGGFDRPTDQSAGIIIVSSEILSVAFYSSGDEVNE